MNTKPTLEQKINFFVKRVNITIRLTYISKILAPLRRLICIFSLYILKKSKTWNQSWYDIQVKEMYVAVRQKEAILLKTKIIDTRKNSQHLKMLIVQSPDTTIEIALKRIDFPLLYDSSKKAQEKLKSKS